MPISAASPNLRYSPVKKTSHILPRPSFSRFEPPLRDPVVSWKPMPKRMMKWFGCISIPLQGHNHIINPNNALFFRGNPSNLPKNMLRMFDFPKWVIYTIIPALTMDVYDEKMPPTNLWSLELFDFAVSAFYITQSWYPVFLWLKLF